ncbi:MAG: NYN domain-containing protein [Phycisphaerae bacterium]|nr:NYN domain-containing protein [Phycisphaerae bacterium]
MAGHVIIDGNNLLHAMHAHAPIPLVGRETMVKVVERWARRGDDDVTLVFDGPVPRGGLSKQMASSRILVRFSSPVSADDVIVELLKKARHPASVRVVTSDGGVAHEARARRSRHTDAVVFVQELFSGEQSPRSPEQVPEAEKPPGLTPDQRREWMEIFGFSDDEEEPFDGAESMRE